MQNISVSRVRCDPTRLFVEIRAGPALIGRANQNSSEERGENGGASRVGLNKQDVAPERGEAEPPVQP